jgi:hypothetical protein
MAPSSIRHVSFSSSSPLFLKTMHGLMTRIYLSIVETSARVWTMEQVKGPGYIYDQKKLFDFGLVMRHHHHERAA